MTDKTVYIETHSDNTFCPDHSAARYFVHRSLNNDLTNFWSPNRRCVTDMLADCGFATVRDEVWGDRLFAEAKAITTGGEWERKMQLAYGTF